MHHAPCNAWLTDARTHLDSAETNARQEHIFRNRTHLCVTHHRHAGPSSGQGGVHACDGILQLEILLNLAHAVLLAAGPVAQGGALKQSEHALGLYAQLWDFSLKHVIATFHPINTWTHQIDE